jgi:nitroreductase
MRYHDPITQTIQRRFSCRTYDRRAIEAETQRRLADFLSDNTVGPFGTPVRLALIAATEADRRALKGLGTYGFIKGATGYIVGAVKRSAREMEDLGYLMERSILYATELGLGTCWLGGTLTRSSFARRIAVSDGETVPAVTSVGYIAERPRAFDAVVRRSAKSDKRLPWEQLFHHGAFGEPISREMAGPYAKCLEMVRLGPSASNKQPWRIIRGESAWHFYLKRSKGYGRRIELTGVADLQRIDMGIAMSHWELTADEVGLRGKWQALEPPVVTPDELTEYIVSWVESEQAQ